MQKEEAKNLFYKLSNSFGGRENDGITMAWVEYLPKQDFTMAKQTIDYFIHDAGLKFMPSISQFNTQLRQIQIQHSLSEVNKIDASACRRCNGLTWESSGEDFIPCKVCRAIAFSRWEAGDYVAGALSNQNELEGPTQAYALPARPQYPPQKPVSPERAKQWAAHIKMKTGYTFPEDVPEDFGASDVIEVSETAILDAETGEIIAPSKLVALNSADTTSLQDAYDAILDEYHSYNEEEYF